MTKHDYKEPIFDIHQLIHTELFTPKPEDSLEFFTKVLGMSVVHEEGKSRYLRAYEDTSLYSLILTENDEPGMDHSLFRTSSPQALDRRVEALEKSGTKGEWVERFGQGKSYRFQDPDGHTIEIGWEIDKFSANEQTKSRLLNRAQRRPLRGVPVRRIDHINLLTNVAKVPETAQFYIDQLGFNLREAVVGEDGNYFATWLSVSALVHELALMGDALEGNGRFHHLAYWYGYPQHLDDLSEACVELGIPIEAGPLKHGVSQAKCMYIIEPGGNRIELFGDSGYLIFEPDWEPVEWEDSLKETAIIWFGGELPETYFRYGTPVIEDPIEDLNVYAKPNVYHSMNKENYDHFVETGEVDAQLDKLDAE